MEYFYSIHHMLFHNFIETLSGSKVKVKILRSLCRFEAKAFTARELANYSAVSHFPVLRSLSDLQGMNIITIESHGTSNLIRINKESCLYPSLKEFFNYESAAFNALKEDIKKMLPHAKSVAMFGSIAVQKEGLHSDIDLLVITDNKQKAEEIISKKQSEFNKKYGNVISAYVMTENEFKRKKNMAFVKDLMKSHILIKGERL